MNDDFPPPGYPEIMLYSGPLGLLVHFSSIACIFLFFWLVWRRCSLISLLLVAVLPLAFGAIHMSVGNNRLLYLMEENRLDYLPFAAKCINLVFTINISITGILLLLTGMIYLLGRLSKRMGKLSQTEPASVS